MDPKLVKTSCLLHNYFRQNDGYTTLLITGLGEPTDRTNTDHAFGPEVNVIRKGYASYFEIEVLFIYNIY